MHYLLLFICALMWSFVGPMVKSASTMVDSSVITLSRFLFGFIFLGIFLFIKGNKIQLFWKDKWIWIGVIAKTCNYIFENIALTLGLSYSNVVIWPVQAIFLAFAAVWIFKEELYPTKALAVVLCLTGIFFVSWKGLPLSDILGNNLIPTILFVLAGIGAGTHVISQKKLISYMDSGNMNFSVFFLASLITVAPVPINFKSPHNVSVAAVCSLIGLGLVTGISFYIYAHALKKVPFLVATIISNSSVLFTFIWAKLFFNEGINSYIAVGIVILMSGLIVVNFPKENIINRLLNRFTLKNSLNVTIDKN